MFIIFLEYNDPMDYIKGSLHTYTETKDCFTGFPIRVSKDFEKDGLDTFSSCTYKKFKGKLILEND